MEKKNLYNVQEEIFQDFFYKSRREEFYKDLKSYRKTEVKKMTFCVRQKTKKHLLQKDTRINNLKNYFGFNSYINWKEKEIRK